MEKEREDKILEAIVHQREDMVSGFKSLGEQNNKIIEKLENHDGRLERIEVAVLANSDKLDKLADHVERVSSSHEQRITKLEQKVGI